MNKPLTRTQEERLQSAIKELDKNQFPKAIEMLIGLSLEASENAEVYYRLGTAYHSTGHLDRAISALEHCLRIFPKHTNASIALSVILNDVGQYERAAEIFHRAENVIRKDSSQDEQTPAPPSSDVNMFFSEKHAELAHLYLTHQRVEEAIREAETASGLTPRDPKTQLILARAYAKKGLVQRALEVLNRAKRENPQYLPARINLGLIMFSQCQVAEAMSEWERVLTLDPVNEEAQRLYRMGQTAQNT